MSTDDIVMVSVSPYSRRPFYNLAKLQPSEILEGPNDLEAVFAKGSPREVRISYVPIKRSEWSQVASGEDYYMEDGVSTYFSTPPNSVVWFSGCLFRRVGRVLSNGHWR